MHRENWTTGSSSGARSAVVTALASLELDDADPAVLADETAFLEIACTLAEEVDPAQTFSFDISAPLTMTEKLADVLSSLDYDGSLSDRASVLDFLSAEAQASRLLAHSMSKSAGTGKTNSVDADPELTSDTSIATSLSRLSTVYHLDINGAAEINNCAKLLVLLKEIHEQIKISLSSAQTSGSLLIPPDYATSLSEEQMDECARICEALSREHLLRKGMLMRRLSVTVQSFGYSLKATDDKFEGVTRRVEQAVESGVQAIGVYDALFARDWLLNLERVSAHCEAAMVSSRVKRILMGSVPDRGGRVGAAANAPDRMPGLRPRGAADSGEKHGDHRGSGRGHGKGHARKRRA
jgi:Protein of unknown function (DUF2465)